MPKSDRAVGFEPSPSGLALPAYHGGCSAADSITLFHVRGIRIAVDWSWFLVLFLVIFWLSRLLRRRARRTEQLRSTPFVLAVVSALGFFGSILLHELGHAIAALRNGIGISSIQLWIFGGMARMDREVRQPRRPSSRWRSPGRW